MVRLGLGCVALGSGRSRTADDVQLVREAVDQGFTVFDTADAYGGGASEVVLGRALGGWRRDEVTLATKGGFSFRPRSRAEHMMRRRAKAVLHLIGTRRGPVASAPRVGGASTYAHQNFDPAYIREAVQASLRRLRTDRIDVYQIHAPMAVHPDLIDALIDLVAVGDVGRFGVGAHDAATATPWLDVEGVTMVQLPFGVLNAEGLTATIRAANRLGIEVWARSVFAGGVLKASILGPSQNPDGEPRLGALSALSARTGLPLDELAMGYVRAHADLLSTVLVGTTDREHLRRNAALFNGSSLEADVLRALEAIAESDPAGAEHE
jgi:aryl-alcohol dehydrogenase-like predicted oxidoreductase